MFFLEWLPDTQRYSELNSNPLKFLDWLGGWAGTTYWVVANKILERAQVKLDFSILVLTIGDLGLWHSDSVLVIPEPEIEWSTEIIFVKMFL